MGGIGARNLQSTPYEYPLADGLFPLPFVFQEIKLDYSNHFQRATGFRKRGFVV
ncbi:hypothetical protein M7I_6832 [Glarea lozoyensis 74030]|uniref:Uncharacterized protein n=1 Tax=Glarea lozoyensis (strain ATCC 74030 / MF5533) TaxID=1104152 RepID=H0EVN2_GLAL7|nr:hypothetical protein M7I_6832 [Glarea lozoyensis 74030]